MEKKFGTVKKIAWRERRRNGALTCENHVVVGTTWMNIKKQNILVDKNNAGQTKWHD